jgi:hypothetical protein
MRLCRLFGAVVTVCIVALSLQIVGKILLLDIVVREIVRILISLIERRTQMLGDLRTARLCDICRGRLVRDVRAV